MLELAATLCHAHRLTAAWLSTALRRLPGFALSAQRLPPPDPDTWIGQLSGLYEAWRNDRKATERILYLEDFLRRPLRADIKDEARLRLAYQYRTRGDQARCLILLHQALSEDPSSDTLRYQVARTLHGVSDFPALAAHLAAYPLGETTGVRIRSDLAFDRGLIDEAVAGTAARARYLREVGQHRLAQENEAVWLWRRALQGAVQPEECDALLTQADRYGSRLRMRTALAAKTICLAGDTAAVQGLARETQWLITAGAGFTGWRVDGGNGARAPVRRSRGDGQALRAVAPVRPGNDRQLSPRRSALRLRRLSRTLARSPDRPRRTGVGGGRAVAPAH